MDFDQSGHDRATSSLAFSCTLQTIAPARIWMPSSMRWENDMPRQIRPRPTEKDLLRALSKEFGPQPQLHREYVDLWTWFSGKGLSNDHFVAEIASGASGKIAQRIWEMLLARHLHDQSHAISCSIGAGPDFYFEHEGTRVWVEAIAPDPTGIPENWLDINFRGVGTLPHKEILLRWTSAICEKFRKLQGYLEKRIVEPEDAYVIAVNGFQLTPCPLVKGITGFPFGVEAVYPVGPLAYKLDPKTGKLLGGAYTSLRYSIAKSNGAEVATTTFLHPEFAHVSALLGCATNRLKEGRLETYTVHNTMAKVPIPIGLLGAKAEEWVATPVPGDDGEWELHRV